MRMDGVVKNVFHRSSAESDRLSVAAWVLLFLVLAVCLHLFVPYPIDDDTAYHFTVGQLIKKHGILHSFPWTPFSWQSDHYADKEFLFHLLFVPLGGLGFVTAARVVGALAGALVLITLYFVLRAEKVPYAGIWTLLLPTWSEFVFRLALVRPHLLSITLALILIWAYRPGQASHRSDRRVPLPVVLRCLLADPLHPCRGSRVRPPARGRAGPLEARGDRPCGHRQEASLSPKIGGKIEKIFVDEGDRVTKGQPLVSLEQTKLIMAKNEAEANLNTVKSELKKAELKISRIKTSAEEIYGNKPSVDLNNGEQE